MGANVASGTISIVQSGTTNTSNITIASSPNPINSTITMDLRIDAAANVWGWAISVNWTASVLQLTGVKEGNYLKSDGKTTIFTGNNPTFWNNTGGYTVTQLSNVRIDNNPITSSSGILATLTFNITSIGVANINLSDSNLRSDSADNVGVTAPFNNATVTIGQNSASSSPSPSPSSSPPPSQNLTQTNGPKARISPTNGTIYNTGATVILDASSSTPGYHNGNVSQPCPITSYSWRVEYINGTNFGSYNGQNASFVANQGGILRIILIVTAPDTYTPPDTNYIQTDSTTSNIQIGPVQNVTNVDVFTDRGGLGTNINSGSYAPQELIQVYALVTYRNVPVVNQEVAFSIQDPNGTQIALRVAVTNVSGIATTNYRLPTPSSAGQQTGFGTWSVVATVNVTQTTLSDKTQFELEYLYSISNVQIASAIHTGETLPIQFTINDFSNSTSWSELDITLFDSAKIPIGSFSYINNQQVQNATLIDLTIPIPQYAFTGQAYAYICLLAPDWTALTPETAMTFQINQ